MFTKLAEYLLPRLSNIAEIKLAEEKAEQDKKEKGTDAIDKAIKATTLMQNIAGTAALGLGAFAIGKAMVDKARESKERELLMARQLQEYLAGAEEQMNEVPQGEKERVVDEVLRKAAEAEIFAKPKEVFEYKAYLLNLPYDQVMQKVAELEKEIARKQLKIGEATGTGTEGTETNVDPLTQWLLEKALYKG